VTSSEGHRARSRIPASSAVTAGVPAGRRRRPAPVTPAFLAALSVPRSCAYSSSSGANGAEEAQQKALPMSVSGSLCQTVSTPARRSTTRRDRGSSSVLVASVSLMSPEKAGPRCARIRTAQMPISLLMRPSAVHVHRPMNTVFPSMTSALACRLALALRTGENRLRFVPSFGRTFRTARRQASERGRDSGQYLIVHQRRIVEPAIGHKTRMWHAAHHEFAHQRDRRHRRNEVGEMTMTSCRSRFA